MTKKCKSVANIGKHHWLKTKKGKAIHSKRMRDGFAVYMHSKITNPSKPQVALFNYIKKFYPTTILNYPYKSSTGKSYSLDVAIPELKTNFEYDCPFWHKSKNFGHGCEVKDMFRDEALQEDGWGVVRVSGLEELGALVGG